MSCRAPLRGLTVLAVVAASGLFALADSPPQAEPPKYTAKELTEIWKKAGAEVGRVHSGSHGYPMFIPGADKAPAALPGFRLSSLKERREALPDFGSPFGLILRAAEV